MDIIRLRDHKTAAPRKWVEETLWELVRDEKNVYGLGGMYTDLK